MRSAAGLLARARARNKLEGASLLFGRLLQRLTTSIKNSMCVCARYCGCAIAQNAQKGEKRTQITHLAREKHNTECDPQKAHCLRLKKASPRQWRPPRIGRQRRSPVASRLARAGAASHRGLSIATANLIQTKEHFLSPPASRPDYWASHWALARRLFGLRARAAAASANQFAPATRSALDAGALTRNLRARCDARAKLVARYTWRLIIGPRAR